KDDGSDDTTTPVVSASDISYAIVKQNVFAKSCMPCHASPQNQGGVNLESFANAAPFGDQIKADVDSGKMPKSPSPPISARQKALIDTWVSQRMPNNPGGPPAPPKPPLEPKFASIKEGIFKMKCLTCHNPTGKAKDVKLDQPSDLLAGQKVLVVPGKPEESLLIKMITPGGRRIMPPATSANGPLSPEQIAQITDWVQSGAVDDTALGDASKFQAIESKIIDPKCTNCHTAEGSAEHIPLDTWKDLTGGGEPFVIPKVADMSYLVELTEPGHAKMPPPPPKSDIPPLTPEEWNVIKDWINSGASQ
ncbi:MAG: c-type cytochrome domain-containing protein, partial [Bdellovibrionota bacterium]